ncbi:hypothetical protein BDV96DRAFT_85810 [Lophiotrema nucula]|uniref:Uncharacterized protein n=1 Tax=Lophiotrema nucula TaxID=690887 RepID=A0A6A5Z5V8_9PLEO|nr:hypothetical protein BDV96DRAFT_85810 [Lophiotrema nucula]
MICQQDETLSSRSGRAFHIYHHSFTRMEWVLEECVWLARGTDGTLASALLLLAWGRRCFCALTSFFSSKGDVLVLIKRDYSYAFSIQFDGETTVQLVELTSIFFMCWFWKEPPSSFAASIESDGHGNGVCLQDLRPRVRSYRPCNPGIP